MSGAVAPDEVRVRPFRPRDLDACLAVFDTNVPGSFPADERAELEAFLLAPPGPYLVLADRAGEIVSGGGYARAHEHGSIDVCWGMVRRELHGRGLGRLLTLARLERAATDAEVDAVCLRTSQHTAGFYERLGFRTVAVERDGFGPGLDRVEMRWDAGDEETKRAPAP